MVTNRNHPTKTQQPIDIIQPGHGNQKKVSQPQYGNQ